MDTKEHVLLQSPLKPKRNDADNVSKYFSKKKKKSGSGQSLISDKSQVQ